MDNTTLRRVKDNIRDRFAFDLDAIENANLVKFVHIRLDGFIRKAKYVEITDLEPSLTLNGILDSHYLDSSWEDLLSH